MRSLDLSGFPPDLAEEIRERSEAQHLSTGEVVADLVRIGLRQTTPLNRRTEPFTSDQDIIPDIVDIETINIPRDPGIRCTNVRIVSSRPISPLLVGSDYETPE